MELVQDTRAPWETYGDELDVRMDKDLESAVNEYAEKRYAEHQTSTQNIEELHRQREINEELVKEYQWLRPEEYEDHGARVGRVMTHAEFITRLREGGVSCHYRQHVHADKAVLYITRNHGLSEPVIACWVQIGLMPELSIMNFDNYGLPTNERRRGWRTCLLQLILGGHLTEEKANKIFGKPKESFQFHRYNSTLQSFRNAGSSLGE